jgi:hypothetical protein
VTAWRSQNPGGTSEQLVADIGCRFRPDYGVVLRAVLFAADRHNARGITGICTGPEAARIAGALRESVRFSGGTRIREHRHYPARVRPCLARVPAAARR